MGSLWSVISAVLSFVGTILGTIKTTDPLSWLNTCMYMHIHAHWQGVRWHIPFYINPQRCALICKYLISSLSLTHAHTYMHIHYLGSLCEGQAHWTRFKKNTSIPTARIRIGPQCWSVGHPPLQTTVNSTWNVTVTCRPLRIFLSTKLNKHHSQALFCEASSRVWNDD